MFNGTDRIIHYGIMAGREDDEAESIPRSRSAFRIVEFWLDERVEGPKEEHGYWITGNLASILKAIPRCLLPPFPGSNALAMATHRPRRASDGVGTFVHAEQAAGRM
jgi:hypothetical protein